MKGWIIFLMEMPKLGKREPFERVAFYGPMCSGKTFLAKALVNHRDFTRVALADKLKSLVYDLYGVTGKDGSSRKLLQEFADDIKKWDSDVFIKHLLFRVQSIENTKFPPKIICDDVRFKREADILRKNGFTLISVVCEEDERLERIARLYPNTSINVQQHRSEKEFDLITPDYIINSTNVIAVMEVLRLLDDENRFGWQT